MAQPTSDHRPPQGARASDLTFRAMRPEDREEVVAFTAQIWEGHDYLGHVFDKWVKDPDGYFAAMLRGDRVVGCGRLMPMDTRRGWLEGLRVDPALQGQGLGKQIALHVMRAGRERGFQELLFSTYFANAGSIRINEIAGFEPLGTCTNLEFEMHKAPDPLPRFAGVTVTPGVPATSELIWNDWLFLPPDLAGREAHLPNALTIARGACRMLLADNAKYPHMLDIGWMEAVGGEDGRACLLHAMGEARQRGRRIIHAMVPEAVPLDPFRELGFFYFEQPQDVHLYRGTVSRLRLNG
jgi:GNAT superfamily N-acetyltransferase